MLLHDLSLGIYVKDKKGLKEANLRATERYIPMWDHTVLPAIWHRWTCPTLNPARQACRQAGTWFT